MVDGQRTPPKVFDPSAGQPQGRQRGERSRSGDVRYGTTSNARSRGERFDVNRLPDVGAQVRLGSRVDRFERVGVGFGGVRNGFRVGYVHYSPIWQDDFFFYPHYVFDPFAVNQCVVSPWYHYSFLPPYLAFNRVFFVNRPFVPFIGVPYPWIRPTWNSWDNGFGWNNSPNWQGWENGNWNGGNDRRFDNDRANRILELDDAVADLVNVFERGDRRALDRLIPRRGDVSIFHDGQYSYSVRPEDLYDLLRDMEESARTTRFEILEIRRNGTQQARIRAQHVVRDPWGAETVVFHNYLLERERRDFVIREFGTTGRGR